MSIGVIIAEADRETNEFLAHLLKSDSRISVLANSQTGLEVISMSMRYRPDVVVMTTRLHDLDLKNVISRIMRQTPTPILILYGPDDKQIIREVKDMDIGIIDFLQMARSGNRPIINDVSFATRIHILSKLKIEKFSMKIKQGIKLARARERGRDSNIMRSSKEAEQSIPTASYSGRGRSSRIIVIGTSTGGPRLLSQIVPKLPANLPPIVIVQHMPVGFITAFAKRLNRISKIRVKEAKSSDPLMAGTVYLAPGGKHLEMHRAGGSGIPKVLLTDGEPVNFVKPAVDVTLFSAVKVYGSGVISVILTGMGSDGRDGSRAVKENDGIVLALNEEDADIYGMNRAVIEANLVNEILSKRELVMGIIRAVEGKL